MEGKGTLYLDKQISGNKEDGAGSYAGFWQKEEARPLYTENQNPQSHGWQPTTRVHKASVLQLARGEGSHSTWQVGRNSTDPANPTPAMTENPKGPQSHKERPAISWAIYADQGLCY